MTTQNDPTIPQDSLDRIIAAYLEGIDAGESPDRQKLLERYPQHAEQLRSFFADHDRMDRAAAPLRLARTSDSSGDAEKDGSGSLPRVRYFGDYELLEEIARGGMGIVYKARQVSLNRIVALKMILAGQFASESEVQRFYAEARAAANLQHPNIVAIHEVGKHENQHYFSMDYIEGKSLSQVVRESPLPAEKAARYLKTIAEAIEYSHRQGTLHRDLKPSNVLIDRFDQPQVTDFGLAKRIEGTAQLTATGTLAGTPSYMPPEQAGAHDGKLGPASDVYSMGALLYELLTGRPPFLADTLVATLNQVLNNEPVSPWLLNPKVPRDLETICLKCLEKGPGKRYPTGAALADDLGRFLRHEPIAARPVGQWERAWRWCKRNRTVSFLSAAILVLLLAAAIGGNVLAIREKAARAVADRNTQRATEEAQRADAATRAATRNLYAAQMNLAQQLREQGLGSSANDILRQQIPLAGQTDLRGWEWYYQDRLCHQELRTFRGNGDDNGKPAAVNAVIFSPDGNRLATAGDDGQVRLWDVATARELMALKGHTEAQVSNLRRSKSVSSLAYSPDGKRIASAGADHTVRIWDAITGATTHVLNLGVASILALSFSRDGATLGALDSSGEARLWRTADGSAIRSLQLRSPRSVPPTPPNSSKGNTFPEHELLCAAFGADLKSVASAPDMGPALLWRISDGKPIGTALPEFGDSSDIGWKQTWTVAVSANGRWLATVDNDSRVRLWNVAERKPHALEVKSHISHATCLAFGQEDTCLAGSDGNGTITLWEVPSGKQLRTFSGPATYINGLAFNVDGTRLASAHIDGTIKLWDVSEVKGRRSLPSEPRTVLISDDIPKASAGFDPIQSLAVSSDCHWLAGLKGERTGYEDTVRLLEIPTGLTLCNLSSRMMSNSHFGMAVLPDASVLVAETKDDGHAAVLRHYLTYPNHSRAPSERLFKRYAHHINAGAISRDGNYVAIAADKTTTVWDTASGTQIWSSATPKDESGSTITLGFSPDDQRLCAGRDQQLCVWNIRQAGGKPVFTADTGHVFAFSADNFTFATTYAADVKVWNLADGRLRNTLRGHTGLITCLAFSPDGKRLVSAAEDQSLRIWDMPTGFEVGTLRGLTGRILSAWFSPDRYVLFAASSDGTVRTFDASPSSPHFDIEREARSVIEQLVAVARSRADLSARIQAYPGIPDAVRGRVREKATWFWKVRLDQRAHAVLGPLFDDLLLKSDVVQAVRKDRSLDEELRAEAIRLADLVGDDSTQLNEGSWRIVAEPGAVSEEYNRALRWAEAAIRLTPEDFDLVETLGVAQYRAGQYQLAVATLTRSNEHFSKSEDEGPQATDLAFLAMAHHALGHAHEAHEFLRQLANLLKQDPWNKDELAAALFKEAQQRLSQRP